MDARCLPFIRSKLVNLTESNEGFQTSRQSDGSAMKESYHFSLIDLAVMVSSALICTTNLALIVGLRKTNKTLTLSQKLYIFLSLTDAAVGAISMPYLVVITSLGYNSCTAIAVGLVVSFYSFGVGMGTFFIISVIRNFAIRKPLQPVSGRRVKTALLLWNAYIVLKSLMTFFVYTPEHTSKILSSIYWFLISIITTMEISSIAILNFFSKKELTQKRKQSLDKDLVALRKKRHHRAVVTLSLISLVYAVCFVPVSIFYFVLAYLVSQIDIDISIMNIAFVLTHLPIFLCSGFNAIIYMSRNSDITRYYKNIFCKRRRLFKLSDKSPTFELSTL
jgi:7 transmembrane receptor (rhodopsin family).